MQNRPFALILAIATSLLAVFILSTWASAANPTAANTPIRTPPASPKVDAALQEQLNQLAPDDTIRIIARLSESANLQPALRLADPVARRGEMVNRLQETAVANLASLQPTLDTLVNQSAMQPPRLLWLINAFATTATSDAIATLAAHPAVAAITLDQATPAYTAPEAQFGVDALMFSSVTPDFQAKPWGIDHIGAPAVWQGLGIDGRDVTVAFIDSGVDFTHPDLNPNYRGNLGNGSYDHSASWYSPAITTYVVPTDNFGHGTHVAGTAVGQNGIGVAPGAKWIAVNVANSLGLIFDSDIYAAFAWLLAPNGDPALAPDVINNSWSGSPRFALFADEIDLLQDAGIITVFATGNDGPETGTVGSPASYTNTLAVGASDDIDSVPWFSGRGPSPLTDVPKPWVVAPGTRVLSAFPGGQYAYSNGTSMATPHVSGLVALLLDADPALTRQDVWQVLADTAVPLSTDLPNTSSGYGRIDAVAAIAAVVPHAAITGQVTTGGQPAIDATVTLTSSSGVTLTLPVVDGRYHATLSPGSYTLTARAFGAAAQTIPNLVVANGQTVTRAIALAALPGSIVSGRVTNDSGVALAATVQVLGTSLAVQTDGNGRYQLALPAGLHKLHIRAQAHTLHQTTLAVGVDTAVTHNVQLDPAPTMLIVDSGQWYYFPQAQIYQDALALNHFTADLWPIRDPFFDVPQGDDLLPYDIVFWSNPSDSPGYIYGGFPLVNYLDAGGKLFISGQNVASYDGSPLGIQSWFYSYLQAWLVGKTQANQLISGAADTDFANLYLGLNGGSSATNQNWVDVVTPHTGSLSEPIFYYEDGSVAGMQAGLCRPFRMVYTGFGLEGVRDGLTRAAILQGAIDYFERPSLEDGIAIPSPNVDTLILPGETLVYTLTVQNLNDSITDTIDIAWTAEAWSSDITTRTVTLGPCQSAQTAVAIHAPADTPDNFEHLGKVTAVSRTFPHQRDFVTFAHKTPGDFLLVNDYRFYNRIADYQQALAAAGITFDTWDVGQNETYIGIPRLNLLNAYDAIFWYTGYDWFQPISKAEREQIVAYLAQGGRLFLSSQDFMFYNFNSELAQTYVGTADFEESLEPETLYAAVSPFVSPALHQPLPLTYPPYQNNGDGLLPGPESAVWFWHDRGMAAAIATVHDPARTLFWAVPWETLTQTQRSAAMQDAVGWLSDVGDSMLTADQPVVAAGSTVTYTLLIANDAHAPQQVVSMTNPLPAALTLLPNSVVGDVTVSGNGRSLSWQGTLPPGGQHLITYQAVVDGGLGMGTAVDNPLLLTYSRHDLMVQRTARLWVNAPNLRPSQLGTDVVLTAATPLTPAHHTTTMTLHLLNSGSVGSQPLTATVAIPREMWPLTDTVTSSSGTAVLVDGRLLWQGDLVPSEGVTVTAVLTSALTSRAAVRSTTAVLEDGYATPLVLNHTFALIPYQHFLPLIAEQ